MSGPVKLTSPAKAVLRWVRDCNDRGAPYGRHPVACRRLAEMGLVMPDEEEGGRTTYRITDAGRRALSEGGA